MQNLRIKSLRVNKTVGKSRTFIKACKKIKAKDITVIVPSEALQLKWIEDLKPLRIPYQVLIINSAIKKDKFNTDIVCYDEIHRYASEEFVKVFDIINSKHTLGLTATIERKDGREALILAKLPICDEVPLQEGIDNGWVAKHNVWKLPCKMNSKEKAKLKRINIQYNKYKDILCPYGGNPMNKAKDAIVWINIKKNRDKYHFHLKRQCIYSYDTIIEEYNEYNRKNKANVKPNWNKFRLLTDDEVEDKYQLALAGIKFLKYVRDRKTLLYSIEDKVIKTKYLIEKYLDNKIIVFSQSISFIDDIRPRGSLVYHSKIPKARRNDNLNKFNNLKKGIMYSVSSLTTGVDIKGLDLGIISSMNSSKITSKQTLGRIIRLEDNKIANLFILYTPDTQEEVWLNQALVGFNIKTLKL